MIQRMFQSDPALAEPDGTQPSVFTVGHPNHTLDRLLHLLELHGIEVVADVRSAPWSRRLPWFNQNVLAKALAGRGVKYVFLGKELGGKPAGADFDGVRDRDERYRRMAATAAFSAGIERVARGAGQFRVALLCSEDDPSICHRHLLIAPALVACGIAVKHIRGDGSVQAADARSIEQSAEVADEQPLQLALF
jgi:uncharacterized protein (DUF488 family)